MISLCGLHRQIRDDTLRTCIKPTFHRAWLKCLMQETGYVLLNIIFLHMSELLSRAKISPEWMDSEITM